MLGCVRNELVFVACPRAVSGASIRSLGSYLPAPAQQQQGRPATSSNRFTLRHQLHSIQWLNAECHQRLQRNVAGHCQSNDRRLGVNYGATGSTSERALCRAANDSSARETFLWK
jgi:hypothetical protein